jgi:DNA-binding CsgD family transcriptional regulator
VADKPDPLERLTSRHREVLQLIAEGNTTKDIAAKLKLSVKTVETHRAQLMDRLDIHDVAGLVRFAIRVGLIAAELDPPAPRRRHGACSLLREQRNSAQVPSSPADGRALQN